MPQSSPRCSQAIQTAPSRPTATLLLASKRLDRVKFRFDWVGAPEDLTNGYYDNYSSEEGAFRKFTAGVKLVDRRRDLSLGIVAAGGIVLAVVLTEGTSTRPLVQDDIFGVTETLTLRW